MKYLSPTRLLAPVPEELRSNFIHYFFDISWWGLYAGATAAFLSIYATRIGATPIQIGLLTALPAAISLALSLPAGQFVRRISAWRSTWIAALVSRSLFLLFALIPFFFQLNENQVKAILWVSVLIAVPTTVIGVSFSQLFIEAVPGEWRGTVVGVRNALFSIISFIVTVISGQILTHLPFQTGYQVVFVIGFAGGVMTSYHLWKVRPVEDLCASAPTAALPGTAAPLPSVGLIGRRFSRLRRFLPPVEGQGRRYLRVLGLLFMFNLTNFMVNPLVPEVLVNNLNLSDAWISIGTAANSMIVFIVSIFINRLILRTGNHRGTSLGAALLGVQAAVLALANDPLHYLLSVLIGGVGSGILMTTQMNYNLENVPGQERSVWLSYSLLFGNAALLAGALIGPAVASLTGLQHALLLFGVFRLIAGLIILKMG